MKWKGGHDSAQWEVRRKEKASKGSREACGMEEEDHKTDMPPKERTWPKCRYQSPSRTPDLGMQ